MSFTLIESKYEPMKVYFLFSNNCLFYPQRTSRTMRGEGGLALDC